MQVTNEAIVENLSPMALPARTMFTVVQGAQRQNKEWPRRGANDASVVHGIGMYTATPCQEEAYVAFHWE